MPEKTFLDVLREWDRESTGAWDYPLMAMSAARLGRPDLAVDALLLRVQKNTYLSNGHHWQNEGVPLYSSNTKG